MKQTLLISIIILSTFIMRGQLIEWTLTPTYDTIYVKTKDILEGGKGETKTLWTTEGKELYSTDKKINSFSNGCATVVGGTTNTLEGFVDTSGKFTGLPEVSIAHNYPYFEDEYLVVKAEGKYVMYGKDGNVRELPELQTLYPYSNGFATYFTFQNPEKKKNPYFNMLMPDGGPIKNLVVIENDKMKVIEPKDISFLSAVGSDTGKALAVFKNKLYWFDKTEMCLVPIFMDDESGNKKYLVVESSKSPGEVELPTDSLTIIAKCGKGQTVEFKFDHMLRLLPVDVSASETKNTVKPNEVAEYPTRLSSFTDGKAYGLIYNGKDSIPVQFEKVGQRYGDRAFTKLNGKWGILRILPYNDYTLKINEGDAIPFRHRSVKSTVRIDLPSQISADNINLVIPTEQGFQLDGTSRESKNSSGGNFITYACTLDIPKDLPDTLTDIFYGPATLIVDNVRLPKKEIRTKGWHVKHYSIDLSNTEPIVAQGKAVFEIAVNNDKEISEKDYPFDLILITDSMPTTVEKISEKLYRCTVDNLKVGDNEITVKVVEKDCPACVFPIEIEYSNIKRKESVTIRHKVNETKAEAKPTADERNLSSERIKQSTDSDNKPILVS